MSETYRNRDSVPWYVPTGRVDWPRFLPLAIFVLISAVAAANMLELTSTGGRFYIFAGPILAIVPILILLRLAIVTGRCRSPRTAFALGMVAGGVVYLGYYYFGMVHDVGPQLAWRFDALPGYINFRLQTDVPGDVGTTSPPNRASLAFNWFTFVLMFGTLLWLPAWTASRRAARAFCEKCFKWHRQSYTLIEAGQGRRIATLFNSGNLEKLKTLPPLSRNLTGRGAFTTILFEHCTADCSNYLSVKDVTSGNTVTRFNMYDGGRGVIHLGRMVLQPEEAAVLFEVFSESGREHFGQHNFQLRKMT